MVAISRELFNKTFEGYSCRDFTHPDDPRCTVANLKLAGTVMKGSTKYLAVMYLATIAVRYKYLSKDDIWPLLVDYVRSVSFAVWATSSSLGVTCLSRLLIGRIDHDVAAYVTGPVAGCGIYLEAPARRPIVVYTISAMALEALMRRLYKKIKRRNSFETLGFMVINAILMYKMQTSGSGMIKSDLWFFRPSRMKKGKKIEQTVDSETGEILINACAHAEKGCTATQCYDNVMKETTKFYIGGLLFSAIKLLLRKPKQLRSPVKFLKVFFQWNNMKVACFFGWYVGVYKAIRCCLCRWTKQDKAEYGLIAGFFSGLSYGLNPNLTLLSSTILYVSRIFGREIQEKYQLSRFHFLELTSILAQTVIYNTRLFDPDSCPEAFTLMMDIFTERKFDDVYSHVHTAVEKYRKIMPVVSS